MSGMKKVICCTMGCFIFSIVAIGQNRIVADFSNLKNDKGVCRACLFNNPSSFKGEAGEPFQCVSVPVKNLTAQAVFNQVPAGTYALFVFHDANNNNKMDKNFVGIPKEGYGASKNKLLFASAPSYEENKFVLEKNTTVRLRVKMRNL